LAFSASPFLGERVLLLRGHFLALTTTWRAGGELKAEETDILDTAKVE
jgi:hypothetical protein